MSSASPPAWKYRVCMRTPVRSSNRSSTASRSRKQYQNIEIAPSSSAAVASQTRWEWTRFSSQRSVRIQDAFGGISSPSSFPIASTETTSLFWKVRGSATLRRCAVSPARGPLLFAREAHRLAPDRIVLPQRVPLPVVVHDDPAQVRVTLERDSHQVERFALVPVGGRPDRNDGRHRLAVVDPSLDANPGRGRNREQVVIDAEALRLRLG